jgi:hypothetical protein
MAQLTSPIPDELKEAREAFDQILADFRYRQIDADGVTTGRDFLLKIWSLAIAAPVGIAFIHNGIPAKTLANVFYELGWMQAYGKETLVVRVGEADIPSDFVRTEYVNFDGNFDRKTRAFFNSLQERADYYLTLADQLERNPLLAIDYIRRAYLLTGDSTLRTRARKIFRDAGLGDRAKNSVEQLLMSFCQARRSPK